MDKKIIIMTAISTLIVAEFCRAETRTFTETVRVVLGSRETQGEAREYALLEAKRRVLEQVGVFMSGQIDLVQRVEESVASLKDETELIKQIQAVTAGVTQTEVAGEEWKMEGGVFVLYLTCCVTVETDDVERRISEILKDRQKTEAYTSLQAEVERLRCELDTLRSKLEEAPPAQAPQLREERKTLDSELTASDWLKKGLAATEPDEQIACYSIAISLNPNLSRVYVCRAFAYGLKEDYDRAIADFNLALQIDPNDSLAYLYYFGRGYAYGSKRDIDRAIADYNRALQLDQSFAEAYTARGLAYALKGDLDRAIADYNQALHIDPRNSVAWYFFGIVYKAKGDKFRARRSFQKALELGHPDARRMLDELH